MHARKRLAVFLAVIGTVAVALPAASASTDPTPECPVGYVKNLATGCAPWWQIEQGRLTVALAPASASTKPTPECPVGYVKNLATGCAPWWLVGHGRVTNP
jgi:hypothetical protein